MFVAIDAERSGVVIGSGRRSWAGADQLADQRGFGGMGTPSCLQMAIATPGPISLWRGTMECPPVGAPHFGVLGALVEDFGAVLA